MTFQVFLGEVPVALFSTRQVACWWYLHDQTKINFDSDQKNLWRFIHMLKNPTELIFIYFNMSIRLSPKINQARFVDFLTQSWDFQDILHFYFIQIQGEFPLL